MRGADGMPVVPTLRLMCRINCTEGGVPRRLCSPQRVNIHTRRAPQKMRAEIYGLRCVLSDCVLRGLSAYLHTLLWGDLRIAYAYCVLRCVCAAAGRILWAGLCIAYCVLRMRIAYWRLQEGCGAGCVLRIAYVYCVLEALGGCGAVCVLRIAYAYCVLEAVGQPAYCVLRMRIAYRDRTFCLTSATETLKTYPSPQNPKV